MANAGFGGLGGSFASRFGQGSSFPSQPEGAPQSTNVISDDEFNRVHPIYKQMLTQLIPGALGYDAATAANSPAAAEIANANSDAALAKWTSFGLDPNDPAYAIWKAASSQLPGTAWGSTYGPSGTAGANGASQFVNEGATMYDPANAKLQQQRDENRTTQQQAYNSMMGPANGMIDAAYMDPNYGQVTGQQSTSLQSQLAKVPGLDTTGLTGVYDPTGTYNPQANSKKVWGLG